MRLRSVVIGVTTSTIMVGIIWLYGYQTGNRMGMPWLPIIGILTGILSGAQTYKLDTDKKDDTPSEMLEALRAKEEERVARVRAAKAARRRT